MEPNEPGLLDQLRGGPVGQTVDKVIEGLDSFLGASGKAWLANGLDELRQAVSLGTDQVHDANSPGLWGTITTGEATAERLEGSEKQLSSLDDLRGYAAEKAHEADQQMDSVGLDEDRSLGR